VPVAVCVGVPDLPAVPQYDLPVSGLARGVDPFHHNDSVFLFPHRWKTEKTVHLLKKSLLHFATDFF